MMALMEARFGPKFDLLTEQVQLILKKMVTYEDRKKLEDRVDVLEAVVKQHSRDIEQLKKAQ